MASDFCWLDGCWIDDVCLSFCFAVLYEILCGRSSFCLVFECFRSVKLGCFKQILDGVRCWHLEDGLREDI